MGKSKRFNSYDRDVETNRKLKESYGQGRQNKSVGSSFRSIPMGPYTATSANVGSTVTSGLQTPWLQAIDAGDFSLGSLGNITFTEGHTITLSATEILWNAIVGSKHIWTIDGITEMTLEPGKLDLDGSAFMTEQAAAQADVSTKGQIWVKNDAPNTLWFTDDLGTDFPLGVSAGSQTPWASDIDAAQFQLTNIDNIRSTQGDAFNIYPSLTTLTPAINTIVFNLDWFGNNDATSDESIEYGRFIGTIRDDTAGAEAGGMKIQLSAAATGAVEDAVEFRGDSRTMLMSTNWDIDVNNNIIDNTDVIIFNELLGTLPSNDTPSIQADATANMIYNAAAGDALGHFFELGENVAVVVQEDASENRILEVRSDSATIGSKADLLMRRDYTPTSPAFDGAVVGTINWISKDDAGSDAVYGTIHTEFESIATGNHSGGMIFRNFFGGSDTTWMYYNDGNSGRLDIGKSDGTTPIYFSGSILNGIDSLFITEQAAADTDNAGDGQIWVKTATPNVLMFTDDAGTDTQLTGAGAIDKISEGDSSVEVTDLGSGIVNTQVDGTIRVGIDATKALFSSCYLDLNDNKLDFGSGFEVISTAAALTFDMDAGDSIIFNEGGSDYMELDGGVNTVIVKNSWDLTLGSGSALRADTATAIAIGVTGSDITVGSVGSLELPYAESTTLNPSDATLDGLFGDTNGCCGTYYYTTSGFAYNYWRLNGIWWRSSLADSP